MKSLLLLLMFGFPLTLQAMEAGEALKDERLEARAVALSETIRCVVCEGQSVNDSAALMAKNMRALIREKIAGGASDQGIRDYLSARYGQGILFTPPFEGATWPLWLGPWLFLSLGLGGYALYLKTRKKGFQR